MALAKDIHKAFVVPGRGVCWKMLEDLSGPYPVSKIDVCIILYMISHFRSISEAAVYYVEEAEALCIIIQKLRLSPWIISVVEIRGVGSSGACDPPSQPPPPSHSKHLLVIIARSTPSV